MTLRYGGARGIDPTKDGQGGAMMVTSGDVLLKQVEFIGNVATTVGGAIYAGVGNNISLTVARCEFVGNLVLSTRMDHGGGAIGFVSNGSELKIKKSTFSANSARRPSDPQDPEGPMGGALFIRSLGNIPQTVSIVDSTFSGNRAAAHGGAIYITRTGTLTPSPVVSITDSTFINNIADEDVNDLGDGGAIYVVGATPTIKNTIIAMNRDLSPSSTIVNDLNGTFTSGGYNLLGTIDGSTGINSPSDNAGSIVNPITPLIGVLADNGGFGKTHMPDPQGQWIIDRGRCDPGTLDQRMRRRPYNSPTHSRAPGGNNCDIGAVEYRP
jgi:predicted outer membrane repeat protein